MITTLDCSSYTADFPSSFHHVRIELLREYGPDHAAKVAQLIISIWLLRSVASPWEMAGSQKPTIDFQDASLPSIVPTIVDNDLTRDR